MSFPSYRVYGMLRTPWENSPRAKSSSRGLCGARSFFRDHVVSFSNFLRKGSLAFMSGTEGKIRSTAARLILSTSFALHKYDNLCAPIMEAALFFIPDRANDDRDAARSDIAHQRRTGSGQLRFDQRGDPRSHARLEIQTCASAAEAGRFVGIFTKPTICERTTSFL